LRCLRVAYMPRPCEDVVCGYASEVDCVFKLREAMEGEVAEELLKLAKTDLPSLQRRNDR